MPRKARSYDRHIPLPDPKYGNVKYAKFINYLMERGKKSVAQKIFYDALELVAEKMKSETSLPASIPAGVGTPSSVKGEGNKERSIDGRAVFDQALKNVTPLMELKSRRIGGANYQVPMEVMEPRKTTLGMKWIIAAARAKKGAPMKEKLASEIVDAYNKQGGAFKKREDTHRMAEANKAFAHFARFGRRR